MQISEAIYAVLEAEKDFRSNMPADWDGDPLSDAIADLRAALSAAPAASYASEREKAKRSFMAGWLRYDTASDCDIDRANAEFDAWWPAAPTSPFAKSPEGQELAAQAAEMVERVGVQFVPFASPTASAAVPMAWCQPMNCGEHTSRKFIVRFEDSEMGDAVFDDEAEAREFFKKADRNWNCYLFGTLPRDTAAPPLPKEDGLREALRKLITTATLLYQNSEGCAVNHYGEDYQLHGLPGWLEDCAKDIEAASAVLKREGGK